MGKDRQTETADCKEMSEVVRVSVIKLFGQTIARPPPPPPPHKAVSDDVSFPTSISQDSSKGESGEESVEEKSTSSERSGDEQKKATEKIIPCPRCNSMDTKFCYYNNYNVKQPRHFCKKCQRYWTSGGTMRNVPVGSGRRKSKNTLFPNHPHIMVPEGGGASLKANALVVSPPGFPVSFYPATLYWAGADGGSVLGKHWRGGAVIRPSSMVLQGNPPSSFSFHETA